VDDKGLQKFTFQPNQNQIKFVELYLDFETKKTTTDIANELGITRQAIWKWFKDVNFINWLNSQTNELLCQSFTARFRVAIRKATGGDFNFSKMLFEIEKFYIPAISHNISIKVTEIVITHVIEVINKFIEDDNLKRKIGEELTRINLN